MEKHFCQIFKFPTKVEDSGTSIFECDQTIEKQIGFLMRLKLFVVRGHCFQIIVPGITDFVWAGISDFDSTFLSVRFW